VVPFGFHVFLGFILAEWHDAKNFVGEKTAVLYGKSSYMRMHMG